LNNNGTEALLAAPFAFSAKLVVFLPSTLIKKERPFSLEVFRHTGHSVHLLFALPICRFAPETQNARNRIPLYVFGAISGVFFRYERLSRRWQYPYRRLLLAAVCRFRVTKKRRIATTLFPYSERY